MLEENKSQEKACLFFTSDYHFEMISLPYIKENIKNNKNVIVISENNLEETIAKLVSQINLNNEEKEKILNINWSNNDVDKFKEIKKAKEANEETIIFVKGKENYIENINNNIKNWIGNNNTKVINCYDINEVQENVKNIVKNYDNVLITSGMKKI
jgi:hypothetical protein